MLSLLAAAARSRRIFRLADIFFIARRSPLLLLLGFRSSQHILRTTAAAWSAHSAPSLSHFATTTTTVRGRAPSIMPGSPRRHHQTAASLVTLSSTSSSSSSTTTTGNDGKEEGASASSPVSPVKRRSTRSKRAAVAVSNTQQYGVVGGGTGVVSTATSETRTSRSNETTTIVSPSPAKRAKKNNAALSPSLPPSASTKTPAATTKTKAKKKPRQRSSPKAAVQPPDDWQEIYSLVEELRRDRTAPCDHSGCEALPDAAADAVTFRFQALFSLMLSSQTRDAVVGAAVRALQRDGVLDARSVAQMAPRRLDGYIAKVGFHNNKTKYIQQTVQVLLEKYNGDLPRTAAEMIADLPGVGPKMAFICESVAWGTVSGIGVDTHMHRLFNLLGFVLNTKTPEQTRVQLESWLPRSYWRDVNVLWVGFGQQVQQEKETMLRKAMHCSRPVEALRLLKRCGLDYAAAGKQMGLELEIQNVLAMAGSSTNTTTAT